ncbi:peptide-N4-(N-acetyl-beta-glucosaminyl)asparagine amidase A [Selaginella moellendorffii]|uniref:peptide-N4-(N-acetyl-beta- glucosaminyl)asparagine amidase A n=1 Tax=Selaginella moellendorffii TaxID=88036 RepID=UPI000D1C80AD|nr:peptide-N4-(N-acetyl-beta-glucosaminyl)asparagine amidase A [Selaginella moellendorffii]|eukprot:XP_024538034.1 peptide-N4-(N-acetyl-beta-glucosaminyl)asparagine amidase A [Selaginella moellendorffii]
MTMFKRSDDRRIGGERYCPADRHPKGRCQMRSPPRQCRVLGSFSADRGEFLIMVSHTKNVSIQTSYAPSTQCGSAWTKIVLELTGFCKGSSKEQKIGGVWLGGAQILHASTPLPTPEGTNWTIQRDATSFESLFLSSSNLSLIFLDVTASSSTNSSLPSTKSSYRISVTANFYLFKESTAEIIDQARGSRRFFSPLAGTSAGILRHGDPPTVVSARLQVFVSSHGDDEFWYKKGSSPEMRELVVILDGAVVDAIWPSPVIYSAGINASYWESVGSIGALNSPGYDVILDAFAPVLADGKPHKLGFRVTGATSIWVPDLV